MGNETKINPFARILNAVTKVNPNLASQKEETASQTVVNSELAQAHEIEAQVQEQLLLGKYSVVKPLDVVSGEADLYLCNYQEKSYVAKIYRRDVAIKSEVMQALKEIQSPYVAHMIDTGMVDGKTVEILPYYKNGSLQGKRLSYQELRETVIPCINEALKELHKIGVIHKDLKPSNIMRLDNGRDVAIIDFGISSVIDDGRTVLVTKTGMTPEYSAPETFRSVFLEESDYYSLGITLYELFCGRTPYAGMSNDEITQYMSIQKIPFPDEMPKALKELIAGLTYSDLANRNDKKIPIAVGLTKKSATGALENISRFRVRLTLNLILPGSLLTNFEVNCTQTQPNWCRYWPLIGTMAKSSSIVDCSPDFSWPVIRKLQKPAWMQKTA